MEAFSPDQWLVVLLAFLLGLILGMAFSPAPNGSGAIARKWPAAEEVRSARMPSFAATPPKRIRCTSAAARAEAPAAKPTGRTRPL